VLPEESGCLAPRVRAERADDEGPPRLVEGALRLTEKVSG